jgi:hypothetical protein
MVPRLVVDFRVLFFLTGGLAFLLGVLRKSDAQNVVFGGHSVVLMRKIVVLKGTYFRRRKYARFLDLFLGRCG